MEVILDLTPSAASVVRLAPSLAEPVWKRFALIVLYFIDAYACAVLPAFASTALLRDAMHACAPELVVRLL